MSVREGAGMSSLLQHEMLADVRSRSKGENLNVSTCCPLYPFSDRIADVVLFISGLCQQATFAPQQIEFYSITSSARTSSIGGRLRPSAFAVVKLMTSCNFVGNSIGKSAGLLP